MGEFTLPNARSEYTGVSGGGWNRNLVHATAVVELPTTALQAADITWLMYVPAGAVIVDGFVAADVLDNGGTSLAYNIGDSTTTNLFFANTTIGRTATSAQMAAGARYIKYATATRIKMTVSTTAQTAQAGTLIFGLSYFTDQEINVTTGITPIVIS